MKHRALVSGPRPARWNVPGAPAKALTGEHCPATGWWIPQGSTGSWQYLSEGNLMPAFNGESKAWILAPVGDMHVRPLGPASLR